MEIRRAIDKVRFRINDMDETKHSNYELLLAINDGYRMYHNTCVKDNPDLIARHFEDCTIDSTYQKIARVPCRPSKILAVRCGNKIIHPAKMTEIENTKAAGQPEYYVPKLIGGSLVLLMFPRPNVEVDYSVDYIPEIEELEIDDDLPCSNDVANCIIDYVVGALSGGETDSVGARFQELINDLTPAPCVVESYY